MNVEDASVAALAGRFGLRGRASHGEYLRGRALAEAGHVTVNALDPDRADVAVRERESSHQVTLVSCDGELRAACSCRGSSAVCRHQVAAEHTLWRQVTS